MAKNGHHACKGYSLCKTVSLGQNLKMPKRCKKRFYDHIVVHSVHKSLQKKLWYSKNKSILKMAKIGRHAKAIAFAKWTVWVENKKCQKSNEQIRIVVCKNRFKEHLIFEKWEHSENGQNWLRPKDYSLCKMASLGQKFKMSKKVMKRFFEQIRIVVCKNRSIEHIILEKWEHFENGQNWTPRKGYNLCKVVSLGQKWKMPKRCEKRFYDHIRVVVKRDHWVLFRNLFVSALAYIKSRALDDKQHMTSSKFP